MTKKMILVSTAAALVLPVARAADPPQIKEGLWSIHTQVMDNPGNKKTESTYTLCRNHAYDQSAQELAKTVKGCTKVNESALGGKYSTELHCVVAGTTIDTKGLSRNN